MKLTIAFGALSAPLKEQVAGLKDADRLQKIANAVTLLTLHGYVTDRQSEKMRDRLYNEILSCAPTDGGHTS